MRGRLVHVLNAVFCEPWLIRAEMHQQIQQIVLDHATGQAHEPGGRAFEFTMPELGQQDDLRVTENGVAVIGLSGVIGKRVGALEKSSGVTDVDDVTAALQIAAASDEVKGIVLDVDSPGGTVTGVPELAATVRQVSDQKRVVAFTDTMACSAAYWIASQAYSIVAAPSACLGSIGVYLPVLDQSRAFELRGLHQDLIKAGRYKGLGIPGTSLTEEQRELLQDRVDFIHSEFKAAVRSGRGVDISDEYMQGQDLFGKQAAEVGLADVTGDLETAIEWAAEAAA